MNLVLSLEHLTIDATEAVVPSGEGGTYTEKEKQMVWRYRLMASRNDWNWTVAPDAADLEAECKAAYESRHR